MARPFWEDANRLDYELREHFRAEQVENAILALAATYPGLRKDDASHFGGKQMLISLKNLNDFESSDLDALVFFYQFADTVGAGYDALGIPRPDWLTEKKDQIGRAVKRRYQAELESEMKIAKAEVERYKSQEAKLAEAQAKLADLQSKLGAKPA